MNQASPTNIQERNVEEQESTLVTSSKKPLQLTVGLEYEDYTLESPNNILNQQPYQCYDAELKKEKKHHIVANLGLINVFPELRIRSPHLCLIKVFSHTRYKTFLKVIYDDPFAKSQLEFVSMKIGSGILTLEDFFRSQNLKRIKDAIKEFSSAIKKIIANDATKIEQQDNTNYQVDIGIFIYIFPPFAREIFQQQKLKVSKGSIHVSHVFPQKFADQEFITAFIQTANKSSFRKAFSQERPENYVRLSTPSRTNYSPNPKVPAELIREDMAFRPVLEKIALAPLSNIVGYAKEDIKVLNEVKDDLSAKIEDLRGPEIISQDEIEQRLGDQGEIEIDRPENPNLVGRPENQGQEGQSEEQEVLVPLINEERKIGDEEVLENTVQIHQNSDNEIDILALELAQNKLRTTIELIEETINIKIKTQKKKIHPTMKKKFDESEEPNLLLYDSFEEKFIYVEQEDSFLIEHRCGPLPQKVKNFMEAGVEENEPTFDQMLEYLKTLEEIFKLKDNK